MYLAEAAKGVPVRELCARYGFSDASFYGWRTKYGSPRLKEASDVRRMRQLEEKRATQEYACGCAAATRAAAQSYRPAWQRQSGPLKLLDRGPAMSS